VTPRSDPIDLAEPLPAPPAVPREAFRTATLPSTDPAPRLISDRVRDEVREFEVHVEPPQAGERPSAPRGPSLGPVLWVAAVLAAVAIIAGAMIGLLLIDDEPDRVVASDAPRDSQRPPRDQTRVEPLADDPSETPTGLEVPPDSTEVPEVPEDSYELVPEPPEEIARMDIWLRRERAAELRREARSLHVGRLYPQAEAKWRDALLYHPTSDEAASGLARSLARQAKIEDAVRYGRLAVELSPRDPRNYELLGDLLLAARDQDAARAQYREGLVHAPGDIRLRSRLRRIDY
jgi:hypothetical protein